MGVRNVWIAFGLYRLLLLPVTLGLIAAWAFFPLGISAHGLTRILTVLWAITLIPPIGNSVYKGWKRLSVR